MQRRIISIFFVVTTVSGCKARQTLRADASVDSASGSRMTEVILDLTSNQNDISARPYQFWMHRNESDRSPILASNRSTRALQYVARNEEIDIAVSPLAIKCMGAIILAVESADLKKSKEWQEFRKKNPYRFLEVLPTLSDYHSFRNERANDVSSSRAPVSLPGPALWVGMAAAQAALPGDSDFKTRGYLRWQGVLQADGITCQFNEAQQIRSLLLKAMQCEDRETAACDFSTEAIIGAEG